jgi:hypothetical protein
MPKPHDDTALAAAAKQNHTHDDAAAVAAAAVAETKRPKKKPKWLARDRQRGCSQPRQRRPPLHVAIKPSTQEEKKPSDSIREGKASKLICGGEAKKKMFQIHRTNLSTRRPRDASLPSQMAAAEA